MPDLLHCTECAGLRGGVSGGGELKLVHLMCSFRRKENTFHYSVPNYYYKVFPRRDVQNVLKTHCGGF